MNDFVLLLLGLKSQYVQLRLQNEVPCNTTSSTGFRPTLGEKT